MRLVSTEWCSRALCHACQLCASDTATTLHTRPHVTLMSPSLMSCHVMSCHVMSCRSSGSLSAPSNDGQSACGSCHCALVRTLAPRLQQQGRILLSELYTAAAVDTLMSAISTCSREFAVQLLESEPSLKLSQLLSLDSCAADVKVLTQCLKTPSVMAPPAAPADATQRLPPSNMWDELVRESACAISADPNQTKSGCQQLPDDVISASYRCVLCCAVLGGGGPAANHTPCGGDRWGGTSQPTQTSL
jgi:hypothetical protein